MIFQLTTNHDRALSIAIVDEGACSLRSTLGALWEGALVPSTAIGELETTLQRCVSRTGLFQPFRRSGDLTYDDASSEVWFYSFGSASSMASALVERSFALK